ncbi:hypothetical protein Tco_0913623 [Tanacetum coccineum]
MGLPSTPLDEGTRKSQHLPVGKKTNPKDSEGNNHPANIGLLSTRPDEALLVNSDKELKDDSEDDVFKAGEEMDEDIQEHEIKETHQSMKEPHS